jgi:hypothetical protein
MRKNVSMPAAIAMVAVIVVIAIVVGFYMINREPAPVAMQPDAQAANAPELSKTVGGKTIRGMGAPHPPAGNMPQRASRSSLNPNE